MPVHTGVRAETDALALLESEDLALRELFAELWQRRDTGVEGGSAIGDVAEEIVRHVGVREAALSAALADVPEVAWDHPRLRGLASRIEHGMETSRPLVDRVETLSRGLPPRRRQTEQEDLQTALEGLVQVVGTEIEWDLSEAIPELRGSFGP